MRELSLIEQPHRGLWDKFVRIRQGEQIPQALLLSVPPQLNLQPILDRLLATFLCSAEEFPCGHCLNCKKILHDTHPDVHMVRPESLGGTIKIEQLRDLQQSLFQSPHCVPRGLVLIYPAEAMNAAAAAALLKILEEPPATRAFILVSSHPRLLLPTLLSRCQRYQFEDQSSPEDPFRLGQSYPLGSARANLYEQRLNFLRDLDESLAQRLSICRVAERWSSYPLNDMLWLLYGLTAKLIQNKLLSDSPLQEDDLGFKLFQLNWQLPQLFELLDEINGLMAILQKQISLNGLLSLEKILLAYQSAFIR